MPSTDLNGFYTQTLKGLGVPVTSQNLQNLAAWQKAEGGWTHNAAAYNPFNTTRGSNFPSMNSVGVRVYPNMQTGVKYTIDTLKLPYYTGILNALSHSAPTNQFAQAVYSSPWGTKHGIGGGGNVNALAPVPAAPPMMPAWKPPPLPPGLAAAMGSFPNDLKNLKPGQLPPSLRAALPPGMKLPKGQIPDSGGLLYPPLKGSPKSASGQLIVQEAYKWLGTPYSWAGGGLGGPSKGSGRGANTVGFDCSGLLQYLWGKVGIKIPRTTYTQWRTGKAIDHTDLQAGDAVFFHNSKAGPTHVGIYIGNDQFIQAPHTGDVVKISRFSTYGGYVGARRYR